MEEYMEDDHKWSVAPSSVAPSSTKYNKTGCLPLLSNTTERQQLCVIDKQDKDDAFKNLSTKVHVLSEKEAFCDSQFPPGLVDDIFSLHEDYPQKKEDYNVAGQTDRQEKHSGEAVSESLKKFKTFGTEENIGSEGQLCSHYSELDANFADPNIKNKPALHAVVEKELQNPETSIDQNLKAFFARQNKTLKSVNDKGSHKANTITASELQLAVSVVGIRDKVLLWKPNNFCSKLSKPLNTETTVDETLYNSAKRNILLQDKVNLSGNSKSSFVPSLLLSPKQFAVRLAANSGLSFSKQATSLQKKVTNKQIPGKFIKPEPPDLTKYTCSEELKKALQANMSERRSCQPDRQNTSQVKYHPYNRTETNYQKTLPKLPEF